MVALEVTRIGTHDAVRHRAETKVIFLLGTFIYITFEGIKPSWLSVYTVHRKLVANFMLLREVACYQLVTRDGVTRL